MHTKHTADARVLVTAKLTTIDVLYCKMPIGIIIEINKRTFVVCKQNDENSIIERGLTFRHCCCTAVFALRHVIQFHFALIH